IKIIFFKRQMPQLLPCSIFYQDLIFLKRPGNQAISLFQLLQRFENRIIPLSPQKCRQQINFSCVFIFLYRNFYFTQNFYRMDKLLCQVINQNRLYPEPQIMQLFIANYTCPLLYFLHNFLRYIMSAGKKQMKFLLQRIPHVFSPGSPVIKPFCFLRLHAVIKINISFAESRRVIFTLPYRFLFPDNLSNIFVSQQAIGFIELLRFTDMFRSVGTSSSETSRIFFA